MNPGYRCFLLRFGMEFLDCSMAITRWEPLRGMEDLLDRYTRSMAYPFGRSGDIGSNSEWCPRVDIVEMNDAFKIKAEIPGVKKEDVHVTLDNGVLTLEGERRQHRERESFGRRIRTTMKDHRRDQ